MRKQTYKVKIISCDKETSTFVATFEKFDSGLPAITKRQKVARNQPVREAYRMAFLRRYGEPPILDTQNSSIISKIVDRIGVENAIRVVEFYVSHNNTFYASKCHAIKFCLGDLDSLLVQTNKGKAILKSDLKRFEEQTDIVQFTEEQVAQAMGLTSRKALNEPS